MDFDLTDKTLHLTLVPPLGGLLRLGDEGSGFVQVLLDFRLQRQARRLFPLMPRDGRPPRHGPQNVRPHGPPSRFQDADGGPDQWARPGQVESPITR